MKFLPASLVFSTRDGDDHLADEARGEGVTTEAILLMYSTSPSGEASAAACGAGAAR